MAISETTKKDTLLTRSLVLLEHLAKLQLDLESRFDRNRPETGGKDAPKQRESNILDELGDSLGLAAERVGRIAEFLRDNVYSRLD